MDVFGKLNEFLNNEDESFKYDSVGTIDDSVVKDQSESPQQNENQSQNSSKSSPSQENSQKLRRSKRGRGSENSQNSSNDDIFDLTNEFIFPTHGGKKNRRKLADEIPVVIEEQIDLSNIATPDSSLNNSNASSSSGRGRGKKGRKPKAPRKVSYKKALELLTAPIPEVISQPSSEFQPQATSTQRTRSNDFAVDLTGDVEMGDIHNKNPLFQKVDVSKEKTEKPEERFSLGLDDDIDLIYVNVKIKGKIKKYRIKMDERFYDLFKLIADDEDIPVCNVVLFHGEKRIYPVDTPDSTGHRVSYIYTCRFMDSSNLQVNKKDKIEIKFQSDKWKKPIALKVSRFEPFLSHIQLLCKEVNFKPEQFTLKFDGDDIDMKSSAIELEFEGGEIIDCRVKT